MRRKVVLKEYVKDGNLPSKRGQRKIDHSKWDSEVDDSLPRTGNKIIFKEKNANLPSQNTKFIESSRFKKSVKKQNIKKSAFSPKNGKR